MCDDGKGSVCEQGWELVRPQDWGSACDSVCGSVGGWEVGEEVAVAKNGLRLRGQKAR